MNERRNAHAAGESWRKWEGPQMHYEAVNRLMAIFIIWLSCINLGALLAFVVSRLT